MSGKVMIIGTGNVGASIAFALVNQRTPVTELNLFDINGPDSYGEALDLNDALAVVPSWMQIRAIEDYSSAKDTDICVITAGANQKPGESRTALVEKNAKIIQDIVEKIMATGFQGIFLVVSNPVDALTQLVQEISGLLDERVIGSGTVLDSARLRNIIANQIGVNPKSVHAYQIGEHGDTGFPAWSCASFGGQSLFDHYFRPRRIKDIEDRVRGQAYEIIKGKGATHYGIAACAVQIINCILNDECRILPVSNYDDFNHVYYGYPTIIGRSGVIQRLKLNLTEEEGIKLQKSINSIRETLSLAHKATKNSKKEK